MATSCQPRERRSVADNAGRMTTDTMTITADAAGTWQLGDLTVNRIGFGAMRLMGNPFATTPRDREAAIAVLRRAVELGVDHIDTAAFYFTPFQSSNELIAAALQPYADDLVIVTKVGPSRSRAGEFEPYARPDQLRAQVEENLRQLGRDHLDVVNLRWGSGPGPEDGSVAEHVGAMAELRDAGLIRHVGVSNVTAEQLSEALAVTPIVCVQNRYGLTDRDSDDVLRMCAERGIAFVPFFSMAAGIEGANPFGPADLTGEEVIAEIATAHGATPAQVRLAWTLHQGPHVLTIPGTGNLAHLEENIAAGSLHLTDDDMAALSQI